MGDNTDNKRLNDQLGAFADIADLLDDQDDVESHWDKEKNSNFEYQEHLEREEKRMKKLDALFTHKFENFRLNSHPEQITLRAKEKMSLTKMKLIRELKLDHSSLHTEMAQMWNSLFQRIEN